MTKFNAPGTFNIPIEQKEEETCILLIEYNSLHVVRKDLEITDIELFQSNSESVSLFIIYNFRNNNLLNAVRNKWGIHSLTLEDIVNGKQRCKYENFDNYETCTLQKYAQGEKTQVTLILTGDIVLVFAQEIDNVIEKILNRIFSSKGRIRERDSGYCAYAIMDSIVDTYFEELEIMEEKMDTIDEKIETNNRNISKEIFEIKRRVLDFKKVTLPLREMINSLFRNEDSLFFRDQRSKLFLRDLQDHILRITEGTEALKDSAYSLLEMHTNAVGLRMNEIMKILTLITTIFTPIMFIASVYGMNFKPIPETELPFGYGIFWGFTILLTILQFYFFKRKKWL